MTDWIETYRGAVPPWTGDVTEHFTIAYYFDLGRSRSRGWQAWSSAAGIVQLDGDRARPVRAVMFREFTRTRSCRAH